MWLTHSKLSVEILEFTFFLLEHTLMLPIGTSHDLSGICFWKASYNREMIGLSLVTIFKRM